MNRCKRSVALLGIMGIVFTFVSSQAFSEPINFSGPLKVVQEDNGGAIYSGVPIGTEFFLEFDLVTGLSSISDGTTVTFGADFQIDIDDGTNNAIVDASGAALINSVAGTSFVPGDIIDIMHIETCPLTSGGGHICFWVTYILDPLAFDIVGSDNYPPDPGDILATVFDIEEVDNQGLTFFYVTGAIDSDGAGDGNGAPAAFALVSPADGATGLGTSLTFVWKKATDPNSDSLSYQFYLCEVSGFAGCTPTVVASAEKQIDFAGAEGLLPLVLFGTVLGGIGFRRRKWQMMAIVSLAIIGLVSSCGGGGDGPAPAPTDEMSHTVSGLKPATTYYWKISVSDGNSTVESATRSFTTQ